MLILLIITSAVLTAAGAWMLANAVFPGAGMNALVALVAGAACAGWWGRGPSRLTHAYLHADVERVRALLSRWGVLLGPRESALVALQVAVDARRPADVTRALDNAEAAGCGPFARAWAAGWVQRLDGHTVAAARAWEAGLVATAGLERAELACECALLLLQGTGAAGVEIADEDLARAITLANQVDGAVRSATGAPRGDVAYIAAFQAAVRGLIARAQDRPAEAVRRLGETLVALRNVSGPRAARLALVLEIERQSAISAASGQSPEAVLEGLEALERYLADRCALPALKRRLVELAAAAQTASARDASAARAKRGALPGDGPYA